MTRLIGSEINHSDWQRNTVVQILPHKGTLGVLQGKVARDGTVDVMKIAIENSKFGLEQLP